MRYLGGKARLCKLIADEIYARRKPGDTYLEPFMGGGSVMTEVLRRGWPGQVYLGDANRTLVNMWQALQLGWTPPDNLTQNDYLRFRAMPDEEDPTTAYLAFGGSFGAKWFGSRTFYPDQLAATRRSLLRTREVLRGEDCPATEILPYDYRDWTTTLEAMPGASQRAVIYCDPPYAATTGYDGVSRDIGGKGGLDYTEFWTTMRRWAGLGHTVLVSEYTGGPGAELIWERTMKGKMTKGGAAQDRLFLVRP